MDIDDKTVSDRAADDVDLSEDDTVVVTEMETDVDGESLNDCVREGVPVVEKVALIEGFGEVVAVPPSLTDGVTDTEIDATAERLAADDGDKPDEPEPYEEGETDSEEVAEFEPDDDGVTDVEKSVERDAGEDTDAMGEIVMLLEPEDVTLVLCDPDSHPETDVDTVTDGDTNGDSDMSAVAVATDAVLDGVGVCSVEIDGRALGDAADDGVEKVVGLTDTEGDGLFVPHAVFELETVFEGVIDPDVEEVQQLEALIIGVPLEDSEGNSDFRADGVTVWVEVEQTDTDTDAVTHVVDEVHDDGEELDDTVTLTNDVGELKDEIVGENIAEVDCEGLSVGVSVARGVVETLCVGV